jgi:sorbitol-specific phosphotransferase system component IIC
MVAAMYVGMLALDPVYSATAGGLGYENPWTQLPVMSSFVMAFNMTLPMALWMRHHHHP